ncbi:MAG TPA: hypothetical protein VGG68_09280 [Caulobacteraceae bacterium]|jgi:hypothetical protein
MFDDLPLRTLLAVVGGLLALAFVATFVGARSQTPAVITAGANALAQVISAAVSPSGSAPTNGNLGHSSFTTPGQTGGTSSGLQLAGLWST